MIGLLSDKLFSFDQKILSLRYELSLLISQALELLLVELDLLKVQTPLVSLFILLDLIIPIEDLNFLLQFFELSINLL